MSNIIQTMEAVSKEVRYLYNAQSVARKTMNSQYDSVPSYLNSGAGDSIRIKKPQRFIVSEAIELSSTDGEVVEESATLAKGDTRTVPLSFTSKELAQDLAGNAANMALFSRTYLSSAVQTLAASVDQAVFDSLLLSITNDVVSVTDTITLETIARTRTALNEMGAPLGNRSIVLNNYLYPRTLPEIVTLMIPVRGSSDYREGDTSPVMGFNIHESNCIPDYAIGSIYSNGAPTTQYTLQSGKSEVFVKNNNLETAVSLRVGDQFTIEGVYSINPVTNKPTNKLKVLTSMSLRFLAADSYAKIELSEVLYAEENDPRRNISALPAGGALISATNGYRILNRGLAYHRDAFVFATQDLPPLDGYKSYILKDDSENGGLSLRMSLGSVLPTSKHISRLDILFGAVTVIPEWATFISELTIE